MDVEFVFISLQRGPVDLRDFPYLRAELAGGVVHRVGDRQSLAGIKITAEQRQHRLRARQTPTGQNDKNTLARLHERVHLSAGIDLIESSLRPRVGRHDQAKFCDDAQTIRHCTTTLIGPN